MKTKYIILFLLGVTVTFLSCEDGNKNFTEEFDSVYYCQKEGVNEFDFYSVNNAKVQTITIGRGGHGLSGTSTINLIPFTQVEMDEYNQSIDGNYKLLAPQYYDMPTSVVFEEGVEYRNVDVVFKGNMSELAKTGEYMLPIRLEADYGTVNDNKSIVYFKPNIIVPSIIMEPTGVHVIRMEEGKREKQNFELSFYLDVRNEWDLKLRIENNEDELNKAVQQYNETMGVDYILLPKENRRFESTILFPAGEALASSFVEVNSDNLTMDDYLIPIIPKKVVGMPFDVREAICYIHVMVTGELKLISLAEDMLTSNSIQSGNPLKNMLDDNIKTHYESIWTSNTDPKHDPKYGVYIDIDVSNITPMIQKQIKIDYSTREYANAVPNQIILYVGTDVDNLRKVGELSVTKNNLPKKGGVWTDDPEQNVDMPQFSVGRQEISLIRVSFMSSANGTQVKNLTQTGAVSGDQNSVALSGLKLYGQ